VAVFLGFRSLYYFLVRVLVCEPFFKSYCAVYGRNLHTGVYLHWIDGRGRIEIGDDVSIDGKSSFSFASRYSDSPTLSIGDHTGIAHGVSITVAKRVTIGAHCRIANGVRIFDSPGHPLDPDARRSGKPADIEDVRPVEIGNNVWIGMNAIIMPGVSIGANSVVAAGAVVMAPVPAGVLVAGNPARQTKVLVADRTSTTA
jgi:acetyltransferase-like isoleucine patch superfamily enzyme